MRELALSIDLPFNLIQTLRLAHALVEVGCELHVTPGDARKMAHLRKIFGVHCYLGTSGIPKLRDVSVDHLKPETRIGAIRRSLIFPQAAFYYCRTRWPEARGVRATFPGLPTESRRAALARWLELSRINLKLPEPPPDTQPESFTKRMSNRLVRSIGCVNRNSVYSKGVRIIFSNEGRVFPRKAWNTDYYDWLLESEFVLCPEGDFTHDGIKWTYRFFEAVMCGAIPVVQEPCEAYEGFRFRRMSEPLSELVWSRQDAEYNFTLAMERMTVPAAELRAEVARLLPSPEKERRDVLAPAAATA